MATLPYITGTDLVFDDAVSGASTYQVQRTLDEYGLRTWENIGSPVAASPFDFSDYIARKGMYLRVLPMSGATIAASPSDAVYYDWLYGSADPASLSTRNLEKSFFHLIHTNIGLAGHSVKLGDQIWVIDDDRIDYDDNEFDSEGKTVWISISALPAQGTNTYIAQYQIACLSREPNDRYNDLVKQLADLVLSSLNVSGYPVYDFREGAAAVRLVSCGMTGTPLYFAPRCRIRGQAFYQSTEVTMLPLTFNLYLYREAVIP